MIRAIVSVGPSAGYRTAIVNAVTDSLCGRSQDAESKDNSDDRADSSH
jgi:hypothetical protein